jgi:hypothetical protein
MIVETAIHRVSQVRKMKLWFGMVKQSYFVNNKIMTETLSVLFFSLERKEPKVQDSYARLKGENLREFILPAATVGYCMLACND